MSKSHRSIFLQSAARSSVKSLVKVVPAAHHTQKTRQRVEQQRRPDVPMDRVGAVAQDNVLSAK